MNESLSCSPGFKFLYLSTKMGRFISILSNLLFIFLNLLGLPLQFIYQVVFYDWQRCCGIMSQSLHHCNINIHKRSKQYGQHYLYDYLLFTFQWTLDHITDKEWNVLKDHACVDVWKTQQRCNLQLVCFLLLTQKWRHQVIFINVLQDFTNVGLAVFFFACKIAQSLFPQTHLTVPIAFTGLHDFPVLLILHVVMHDLLVPAETGCSVTFALFCSM